MNGGAYGAGKAGTAFDPVQFIQRPPVILRIVSWVFAIVVFGCISAKGYIDDVCAYNRGSGACGFGVFIGVIAFLAAMAFLALDALFENFSSVKTRKHVVLGDLFFSGGCSFFWFVTFCYLADQWGKSNLGPIEMNYVKDNLRAAIVFSFFSIFTWAGSCYFAYVRYKQGSSADFAPSYDSDPHMGGGGALHSTYTGANENEEGYQEPPFSTNDRGPMPNAQNQAY